MSIRDVADREIRRRFGEDLQNGSKRSFGLMRGKR